MSPNKSECLATWNFRLDAFRRQWNGWSVYVLCSKVRSTKPNVRKPRIMFHRGCS
jgi:hypothetical protein